MSKTVKSERRNHPLVKKNKVAKYQKVKKVKTKDKTRKE